MLRINSFLLRSRNSLFFKNIFSRSFCENVEGEEEEEEKKETWHYQDSLPVLPLPNVKDTCNRYREYLQPLITPEEYIESNKLITQFENTSLAEDLQSQLLELQSTEPSWLTGFWDNMYLNIRDPLPINVNPFFSFREKWEDEKTNDTAARLIHIFAKVNKAFRMRKLEPDMEGNKPLCMYQYSKLFGCNRYPKEKQDVFSSNRFSRNAIVMRHGKMFVLPVEDDEQNLYPAEALAYGLNDICNMAGNQEENHIGYLTCSNRDSWAKNYQKIQNLSDQNRNNLDLIAGSLIVLNLDDLDLGDDANLSNSLLHNRGYNRWFDKLQLIVSNDGRAGFNMEHTPIDGSTLVRIISDMHLELSGKSPFEHVKFSILDTDEMTTPQQLLWDIDTDLKQEIKKTKSEFESFADSTQSIPEKSQFGKRVIKSFKISPDAFVQMAIQFAYYKSTGKFDSTYESASTKQFLQGRTETIRTVSDHSKRLCIAITQNNQLEAQKLLKEACSLHSLKSNYAKNGYGVDRHLFGLYSIAKKEKELNPEFKIPPMFLDKNYEYYGSNIVSTSNCGANGVGLFGFGAVHKEGLGVGYIINDDEVIINASSYNGVASKFARNFSDSMNFLAKAAKTETPKNDKEKQEKEE